MATQVKDWDGKKVKVRFSCEEKRKKRTRGKIKPVGRGEAFRAGSAEGWTRSWDLNKNPEMVEEPGNTWGRGKGQGCIGGGAVQQKWWAGKRYGAEKSNIKQREPGAGWSRPVDKADIDACLINATCSPTPSTECVFRYSGPCFCLCQQSRLSSLSR